MNMGRNFKQGVLDGLKETENFRISTVELLGTVQDWTKNSAEILALVDEKSQKMEAGTPKFSTLEEAETYHRLVRKGHEFQILLKDQLPRFMNLYQDAQRKIKEANQ